MTELESRMRDRVRAHVLTSFAGLLVAIVLGVVGGFVARALTADGSRLPAWVAVVPALLLAIIPVNGIVSAVRNLRCPSCESSVVWPVMWRYSAFASRMPPTCPSCRKQIFDDDQPRRFLRVFAILVAVGAVVGVVSSVMGSRH